MSIKSTLKEKYRNINCFICSKLYRRKPYEVFTQTLENQRLELGDWRAFKMEEWLLTVYSPSLSLSLSVCTYVRFKLDCAKHAHVLIHMHVFGCRYLAACSPPLAATLTPMLGALDRAIRHILHKL